MANAPTSDHAEKIRMVAQNYGHRIISTIGKFDLSIAYAAATKPTDVLTGKVLAEVYCDLAGPQPLMVVLANQFRQYLAAFCGPTWAANDATAKKRKDMVSRVGKGQYKLTPNGIKLSRVLIDEIIEGKRENGGPNGNGAITTETNPPVESDEAAAQLLAEAFAGFALPTAAEESSNED